MFWERLLITCPWSNHLISYLENSSPTREHLLIHFLLYILPSRARSGRALLFLCCFPVIHIFFYLGKHHLQLIKPNSVLNGGKLSSDKVHEILPRYPMRSRFRLNAQFQPLEDTIASLVWPFLKHPDVWENMQHHLIWSVQM